MAKHRTYTDSELIAIGREFAIEHDGLLRQADWTASGVRPSRSTICLRFGSWDEFCRRCRIKDTSATAADLVKAGRKLALRDGGRLRSSRWDEVKPLGVGRSYVLARFGTWSAFQKACSVRTEPLTDAELVAWGQNLLAQHGKLTISVFNQAPDRPCTHQTIFNRFGSFSAYADAVERAATGEQLAA
jgi:hypothetical protein